MESQVVRDVADGHAARARWDSIDFIKGLACIAVVLIHVNFPWPLGNPVKVCSRFAVPLFLVVSGFFFTSKGTCSLGSTARKLRHALVLAFVSTAALAALVLAQGWADPDFSAIGFFRSHASVKDVANFFVTNAPPPAGSPVVCLGACLLLHLRTPLVRGRKAALDGRTPWPGSACRDGDVSGVRAFPAHGASHSAAGDACQAFRAFRVPRTSVLPPWNLATQMRGNGQKAFAASMGVCRDCPCGRGGGRRGIQAPRRRAVLPRQLSGRGGDVRVGSAESRRRVASDGVHRAPAVVACLCAAHSGVELPPYRPSRAMHRPDKSRALDATASGGCTFPASRLHRRLVQI